MTRRYVTATLGLAVLALWGCQQNDPKPGTVRQDTVLFIAGLEIPEGGTAALEFPATQGVTIYLEVDSIDPLAEPDFQVIEGADIDCEGEIPEEDIIIATADDLRPGEAQDSFDPPSTGTYTVCFTDDNNAPGETSYNVTITEDAV